MWDLNYFLEKRFAFNKSKREAEKMRILALEVFFSEIRYY